MLEGKVAVQTMTATYAQKKLMIVNAAEKITS